MNHFKEGIINIRSITDNDYFANYDATKGYIWAFSLHRVIHCGPLQFMVIDVDFWHQIIFLELLTDVYDSNPYFP